MGGKGSSSHTDNLWMLPVQCRVAPSGMTVTITQFQSVDAGGYMAYNITYTQANTTVPTSVKFTDSFQSAGISWLIPIPS